MAKTLEYVVSFNPAQRSERGYWTIRFNIGETQVRHDVQASSLPELEGKVRALAANFGGPCSPYVRLKDRHARKPSGFDNWSRGLKILAA